MHEIIVMIYETKDISYLHYAYCFFTQFVAVYLARNLNLLIQLCI